MLRYFPFSSTFDLKMGTRPLDPDRPIVEIDENYHVEILLKRTLLLEDHAYYYQASPQTTKAQWEVVEKVLTGLSLLNPEKFIFKKINSHATWENKLLGEEIDFTMGDPASLPMEPLDWVGRQVQEDLLLLDADSILRGGQLCFPSGWDIQSKFGKHFLDLHAPVPSLMGPTLHAAEKLIERIPVHKPIARTNWGFRIIDQMDLSSRHTEHYRELLKQQSSEITEENAGDRIFVRSERQTLSRLPLSGFILFTIHTYNSRVRDECQDLNRARTMLSFLKTIPPDLLEYKVMTLFVKKLIRYLERIVDRS